VPVSAAAISGPAQLVVGEEGFYAATFSPPNASWPLELAWDNGSVGPTTAYSWTQPGLYTLTVTATNPCGEAVAALSVSVTAPACRPVATAAITGPVTLVVGELALYTATVSPPTATLPLTMTWDNGSMGPTAAYSWSLPGIYTVTVIATNACGAASGTLAGTVTVPVSAQQAQLSRRLLPFSIAASFDMVFTHHVSLLTVRVSRCTRHPLRFTLYSSLVTQHALSLVT
jgi:PKD repeat protein